VGIWGWFSGLVFWAGFLGWFFGLIFLADFLGWFSGRFTGGGK
jgi:hypothetical protein